MENKIRQPIVSVCGHVDHGKTTLLDKFRETSIQKAEKGGITQKISFTSYPLEQIKKACPLIKKSGIGLNIPGFLFIDTPGHAAFTNLRKRGGSLADLTILVIDINEGIKPQTAEVLKILKINKTPFIIALNKIDNISGWRTPDKEVGLKESIESQAMNIKNTFNERYMTLIGSLNSYGFESDLYYNIEDFTEKVALIPCSAETGQGIPELMMVLCGLSQKYLSDSLRLEKDAKGVILEIKKVNSMPYAESIIYNGEIEKNDEIAIANFNPEEDPIVTKARILEEIEPLSQRFKPVSKARASTGLRMQLIDSKNILPGMPFEAYKDNLKELKEKFKEEVFENIKTQNQGIIAKADSLGSLEALLILLNEKSIPVVKVGIGNINKSDIISAKANLEINEVDSVIVGFNVQVNDEAKELDRKGIEVLTDDVIYKLIDNAIEFREEKSKEIEKRRLMELTPISKIEILHDYVFRNTNPTIFGVRVLAGKLRKGLNLIDDLGEKIGKTKKIQHERKDIDEAKQGQEIALSVSGTNYERQLKEKKTLYVDLSESQFRKLKNNKDLLSQPEIKTLSEIAEIKRKDKPLWGA